MIRLRQVHAMAVEGSEERRSDAREKEEKKSDSGPSVHSWHIPSRENGTGLNLTGTLNLEAAADGRAVVRGRKRLEKKQPFRRAACDTRPS